MVRKSKAGKARITLGDIEKGLSSGKPSAEIKAAARDVSIAFRKAWAEATLKLAGAFQNTAASAAATMQKEFQKSAAPLIRDTERAKHLIGVLDSMKDEGIDHAFQKMQTEIDAGGSLTARQVAFLIMQARGVDVAAGIKQSAAKWNAFSEKNKSNISKAAIANKKYTDKDRDGWCATATEIQKNNPALKSAAGLAAAVIKKLSMEATACESVKKHLAKKGFKQNK